MTNLEIEAFLSVVKTGSITKAAESLFITQPALSRRIKTLETELGYPLISRKKGVRRVGLTEEGRAFTAVAEKWRLLWQEARDIARLENNEVLNVASVDSVSTYIMAGVFRSFLLDNPGTDLSIRTLHSDEAYGYVAGGFVDLAFVSDRVYAEGVEVVPAFREPMLFVCNARSDYPEVVYPSSLNPSRQIKIPWNPEYDVWHKRWFKGDFRPLVLLDKMSLVEEFLFSEDNWAIAPASVAYRVREKTPDIAVRRMEEGPDDRTIYYLLGKRRKAEQTERFLTSLQTCLADMPEMESLL